MSFQVAVVVAGAAVLIGSFCTLLVTQITAWLWGLALIAGITALVAYRAVHCLDHDEQLLVHNFSATTVRNGPGMHFLNPFTYSSALVRKAQSLRKSDFAVVKNRVTGLERVERGPQLMFLGAYEEISKVGEGVSLGNIDYIIVEDTLTGEKKTVKGPCVWFPAANEMMVTKRAAVALMDNEYVRLKDLLTGNAWIVRGKTLVFLEPTWTVDTIGGGPSGIARALVLKVNQYVQLLNGTTGRVTTHSGECMVFPGPEEIVLDNGIQTAIELDDEHAVLVRDKRSGQQRLVTGNKLFFPGDDESIEAVRELIKLTDHEAMITKDREGVFHYHYGNISKRSEGQPRSFFLPPGSEVVKTKWSRGARREKRDLVVERFSDKPHLMRVAFNCRTSDHVELEVEGVIAWELVDLPTMFKTTSDPPGDICYHVRSVFVRKVSRATLKMFMDDLHSIAKSTLEEDPDFFAARGLKVTALDVGRYSCADRSTSEILEQIIQETTNRMNRLSQVESENEVNLFRTQGQTEQIKLNGALLEVQHQQRQEEASVAGKAEADRVASFLKGLEKEVPSLDDRVKMWQVLRKTDALSVVSKGDANLFFTPADVDLSIETRLPPPKSVAKVANC